MLKLSTNYTLNCTRGVQEGARGRTGWTPTKPDTIFLCQNVLKPDFSAEILAENSVAERTVSTLARHTSWNGVEKLGNCSFWRSIFINRVHSKSQGRKVKFSVHKRRPWRLRHEGLLPTKIYTRAFLSCTALGNLMHSRTYLIERQLPQRYLPTDICPSHFTQQDVCQNKFLQK